MICIDEAVVGIFQIGLQRDYGLLGHVFYLFHQVSGVFASGFQVLDDCSE